MAVKYDPSTLWVALNEISDGNIFQVYPKMLAELFLQEEAARQAGDFSEAEKLVLPSDKEYRLTQYFALVALQKNLDKQVFFVTKSFKSYYFKVIVNLIGTNLTLFLIL